MYTLKLIETQNAYIVAPFSVHNSIHVECIEQWSFCDDFSTSTSQFHLELHIF